MFINIWKIFMLFSSVLRFSIFIFSKIPEDHLKHTHLVVIFCNYKQKNQLGDLKLISKINLHWTHSQCYFSHCILKWTHSLFHICFSLKPSIFSLTPCNKCHFFSILCLSLIFTVNDMSYLSWNWPFFSEKNFFFFWPVVLQRKIHSAKMSYFISK